MPQPHERIKGYIFVGPPTSAKSSITSELGKNHHLKIVRGRDVLPGESDRYGSFRQLIPDDQFLPRLYEVLNDIDEDTAFDNIPRTEAQALMMLAWAKQQSISLYVVKLNLTLEQVFNRTEGRMVCPDCGETYHVLLKPSNVEGKCDKDGKVLVKRQGDMSKAVIEFGFNSYQSLIDRLLVVLNGNVELYELDASGTVAQTYNLVLEKLMKR